MTFNPPPSFPSILDDYEQSFKTGAYGGGFGANASGGSFAANLSGVEKWVRKTASNMQRTYSQLSDVSVAASKRTSGGKGGEHGVTGLVPGTGIGGDLIELVDAFEVGGDDEDVTPTIGSGEISGDLWGAADGQGKGKGNALPSAPAGMSQRRAGAKDGKSD